LLHAALREVLGTHVTQKGSLVDSERLRFDFSHFEAVTAEELGQIAQRVNDEIRKNTPVLTELCDMDSAKEKGAMMLFGEKYGNDVRVLSMGDGFSVELCGGTHVNRTGDIGLLRILSEYGISAGVRRIEAVTGLKALQVMDQTQSQLSDAADLIKANSSNLLEKLSQLVEREKQQQRQLSALQAKLASAASGDLLDNVKSVEGINVLAHKIENADAKSLRDMADSAPIVGGKGGGRPDMAQGGGTDPDKLSDAFTAVENWVAENA